jgi:transposase
MLEGVITGQVWPSDEQVERLRRHGPKAQGKPRVDDQRVLSGILYFLRNGLRWQDAPAVYGPHKTLYNRFARWPRLGVFARIFRDLARPGAEGETLMIASTHLKAHRTAASLRERGLRPRAIGRTKGGLNSKLHMVSDGRGVGRWRFTSRPARWAMRGVRWCSWPTCPWRSG